MFIIALCGSHPRHDLSHHDEVSAEPPPISSPKTGYRCLPIDASSFCGRKKVLAYALVFSALCSPNLLRRPAIRFFKRSVQSVMGTEKRMPAATSTGKWKPV